jgi:hypothetical protein
MAESELDALAPVAETTKLSTGTAVVYEPLKTRQFFGLLRIVTRGAGAALGDPTLFSLNSDTTAQEWGQKLLALILVAVPNAENETVAFIQSMVKPDGLVDKPARSLTKADTAHNAALWATLSEELFNPELEDTLTILEDVVKRESSDLVALGKRLATMMKVAQKTGQVPETAQPALESLISPDLTSSEDSAAPSTSSPASTDGPTTS